MGPSKSSNTLKEQLKEIADKVKFAAIAGIRTGAAALSVTVLAWIASKTGVAVPEEAAEWFSVVLFTIGTMGYNFVIVVLEKYVDRRIGYLLIIPKSPEY